MAIRTSPFRVPFPRRLLIRIHQDLFRIEARTSKYVDWPDALLLVEKMILISEDRRFFRHNGVDYWSCLRELYKIITFQRHGGASTIDMQFVRTATGYYDHNLRRKLYEMLLAILVQYKYSKIEISRSYLNIAFFGSHIYGVRSAANSMFKKESWELDYLTPQEAATIAAMLIYPRPLVPIQAWTDKVSQRAQYILMLYPLLEQRFEKLPRWKSI
jgi:membrane peptidoglycan carboxypeptidase